MHAAVTNFRSQRDNAFATLQNLEANGGGMSQGGFSNRDDVERDQNIQALLKLQEELVYELDMMKADMATLAKANRSLEDDKQRLLAELAEFTRGGEPGASPIFSKQTRKSQRSAAPGAQRSVAPASMSRNWESISKDLNHSEAVAQGLFSPWEVMQQEAAAKEVLEAEVKALRDALKQAQLGQNVAINQTPHHIHAVNMGLISPWEVCSCVDLQLVVYVLCASIILPLCPL